MAAVANISSLPVKEDQITAFQYLCKEAAPSLCPRPSLSSILGLLIDSTKEYEELLAVILLFLSKLEETNNLFPLKSLGKSTIKKSIKIYASGIKECSFCAHPFETSNFSKVHPLFDWELQADKRTLSVNNLNVACSSCFSILNLSSLLVLSSLSLAAATTNDAIRLISRGQDSCSIASKQSNEKLSHLSHSQISNSETSLKQTFEAVLNHFLTVNELDVSEDINKLQNVISLAFGLQVVSKDVLWKVEMNEKFLTKLLLRE